MSRETALRLAKLIPLLGSNQAGEVVATAEAITRTLASGGQDLHALALILTGVNPDWAHNISLSEVQLDRKGDILGYSFARHYKRATFGDSIERPDIPAEYFGLPTVDGVSTTPWRRVAEHCLQVDREVPRRFGGRSLKPFEKDLLMKVKDNHWPTNAQASAMQRILARCHQARDEMHDAKAAEARAASTDARP